MTDTFHLDHAIPLTPPDFPCFFGFCAVLHNSLVQPDHLVAYYPFDGDARNGASLSADRCAQEETIVAQERPSFHTGQKSGGVGGERGVPVRCVP